MMALHPNQIIEKYTFCNNNDITEFEIPKGIKAISYRAFL